MIKREVSMKYIPRIIDSKIELKLQVTGGVVIKGPKWCGKTTTAKQFAKSVLDLQNTKTLEKINKSLKMTSLYYWRGNLRDLLMSSRLSVKFGTRYGMA